MGDTMSSANVDMTTFSDAKRDPLPRQVYLSLRLKELAADLQAIVTERQNLNTTLKDRANETSQEVRNMRERRGYLAVRVSILRAEQIALSAEKESLPPVEKKASEGKKKVKAVAS